MFRVTRNECDPMMVHSQVDLGSQGSIKLAPKGEGRPVVTHVEEKDDTCPSSSLHGAWY